MDIKHAEGYHTEHDVFMFAKMHLQDLAEIYWFRNESEAAKGNKSRSEFYIRKYHEVHDCIRELQLLDKEGASLKTLN
jgi:hypothetical protein